MHFPPKKKKKKHGKLDCWITNNVFFPLIVSSQATKLAPKLPNQKATFIEKEMARMANPFFPIKKTGNFAQNRLVYLNQNIFNNITIKPNSFPSEINTMLAKLTSNWRN